MKAFSVVALLAAAVVVSADTSADASASSSSSSSSSCKCFPGDACWPTAAAWNALNATVGGRLVATVPLGTPCHDPHYNGATCSYLQSQWQTPGIQ